MNEPMRSYMKVGLVHFMAYPSTEQGQGPILETLKRVASDDYFEVVEMTWIKDPEIRSKVRNIIKTSHLEFAYAGMPRLLTTKQNINSLNEEERLQALANLKEGIDEAYEMEALDFAFLSGKYSEDKKEQAYQALIRSTKELCAYAKAKGAMKVALEVFDYDVDKCSVIGPVNLVKRYAEEIRKDFDNFGLMVDLSHLPQLRETPEESLIPVRDHIIHAHIGNAVVKDKSCPVYGDAHPRFGFPGSENDVAEVAAYLRVLLSIGYLNKEKRPVVSLEVKPVGDEDPDLIIANAKRVLNLAWDRV
ncbi:TIM barrel protein [Desulfosporosinus sp. PR]|uniref:sugar phosphate isomerase/epimerase family protein n=1 Tax=Candidatus Desulfosporosinus nitrosoreducens TaxID=3401928 RepID=UPI0027FB37C9|nr:TIM barrel protein [Desulfosporosinus sp. PR]MDQ7092616.1 TIM barrel protein [Desulfosporosinus sp. PR]